jgi:hypothetical protein
MADQTGVRTARRAQVEQVSRDRWLWSQNCVHFHAPSPPDDAKKTAIVTRV